MEPGTGGREGEEGRQEKGGTNEKRRRSSFPSG